MKKYYKIIAVVLIMTIFFGVIPNTFAQENICGIHVSVNGSDENSGTLEFPVKTFERARDIYREKLSQDSDFKGEILVHGGVYRLSESFVLNSADNGLVIRAFGDGEVSVRGSVKLSRDKFTKAVDEEFTKRLIQSVVGKVYRYNLEMLFDEKMEAYPEYTPLMSGTAYYELFSGGFAQTIARWPNSGYARTGNVSADGITFEVNSKRLDKWAEENYGMLCGYFAHNWSFENVYMGAVDSEKATVTLSRQLKQGSKVLKSKRYFAMNMPCEIDIPGEYYIDCEKKILYYYPDKHFLKEDPELSIMTDSLFKITNASDISISGITFEYTRGTAISSSETDGITVDGCILRNIGRNAISLSGLKSVVKNCEIYNIGSGGVNITSGNNTTRTCGNSVVTNNNIYNFGRVFRTYQPGIFLSGFGNRAEYNTVHDAPHCAVRFTGSENVITHNEIYNVVLEGSDSSAIYCGRNWTYWGNEISYNYFHDIINYANDDVYTVSAIYLDDMLSGTKVIDNYFENCSRAMFFGGGKGNKITGNVAVNCGTGIYYDHRAVTGEWAKSETIPGNGITKTAYDGFLEFISNSAVNCDVWKEKYDGFAQLVQDVSDYQADINEGKEEVCETGYPKNVTVTGNKFYGDNVNNDDYIFISKYVYEYGTVLDNTVSVQIPEITIPDNGADETLWSSQMYVVQPELGAEYEYGNVDFMWMRAGGADCYEVVISDKSGNEILRDETVHNGYSAKLDKKGEYTWTVTAKCYGASKSLASEGKFTVLKDLAKYGTYIAGTDFDEAESLVKLRDLGWDFEVAVGDALTFEKTQDGDGYLRFERNENNFNNLAQTFARLSFPEKSSGKITVTYDIMFENFRGAWRDMGSIQTKTGTDVVRIINHLDHLYGVKTTGAVTDRYAFDMKKLSTDAYATIKRTVNLDNNTYEMWIYQNGKQISASGVRQCPDGEASGVMFRFGYQEPYKPYAGEGNAIYRIDNVYVDMGELSPEYTYPKDGQDDVAVNSDVRIKWNDKIKTDSVSKENVVVYENDDVLPFDSYDVRCDSKNIYISFTNGMEHGTSYKIEILNTVLSDSLSRGKMTENYSFVFETEKRENRIYFAEGFEENQTKDLSDNMGYEYSVAEGDSISLEYDEYGSRAMKLVRSKDNLESKNPTYLKMKFNPIEKGIVTVSFDLRVENYRGGIKNLASVTDGENNIISSLFTHSKWIYGQTTSGYNFQLNTIENDRYITVKRKIDTENGVYSIYIYKDGKLINSGTDFLCRSGEMSEILFELAYQSPYTVVEGNQDAVYWIDNIRVDTDEMGVYSTKPLNDSKQDAVSEVIAVFNCDVDEKTVGYDSVKVYSYSNLIDDDMYDISVSGNTVKVSLLSEIKNGGECMVKFSDSISPLKSESVNMMKNEYVFKAETNSTVADISRTVCDFEDWDSYSVTGPGTFYKNGWKFVLYEGDSVSVCSDNVSGGNSLKIVKGDLNSKMELIYDFSVSENKLIKVKFDSYIENNSRKIHDWGSVKNNSDTFLKLFFYQNGFWHNKIGDTKRYICSFSKNTVINTESILNSKTGEYTVRAYQSGKLKAEKNEITVSSGLPEQLYFAISNTKDNYTGTSEGDGVYIIDNVSVEEWNVPTVSNVISDNVNSVDIVFDKAIDVDTMVKGNIKVYDNGVGVTDYILSRKDDSTVTVTFPEKMTFAHKYTFDISEIKSSFGLSMLDAYRFEIVPEKEFKYSSEINSDGICVINIESNIEKYDCIISEFDDCGKLLSIQSIVGEKNSVIKTENKKNSVVYFWNGVNTMLPLEESLKIN